MKFFSKMTQKVLNSMKEIGPSLVFNEEKKGHLIVANTGKSIATRYMLPESEKDIPEFSLFNLSEFCSITSEFDAETATIDFKDKFLTIKTKGTQFDYYYSSKEFIPERPKKFFEDSEFEGNTAIEFILKKDDFQKITKFMKMLNLSTISIGSMNRQVGVSVNDNKSETAPKFKIAVGKNIQENTEHITYNFQASDIKFPVDFDYNVKIMKGPKIAKFSALLDVEEKDQKSEKKMLTKAPIGLEYLVVAMME